MLKIEVPRLISSTEVSLQWKKTKDKRQKTKDY